MLIKNKTKEGMKMKSKLIRNTLQMVSQTHKGTL